MTQEHIWLEDCLYIPPYDQKSESRCEHRTAGWSDEAFDCSGRGIVFLTEDVQNEIDKLKQVRRLQER